MRKRPADRIISVRFGFTVTVTVHPYELLALIALSKKFAAVGHEFKCGRCKDKHMGRVVAFHPDLCAVTLALDEEDE